MKKISYFKFTNRITGLFLVAGILHMSCQFASAQNFLYKSVPASFNPSESKLAKRRLDMKTAMASAFDLTSSLPVNYLRDGSVDYTAVLQNAINNHSSVVFPDFPIQINQNGLTLKSNSVVCFRENSKLILRASDKPKYELLRIHNLSNVTIYFPNIEGDRKQHIGATGEWGMGISIRGSSDITIVNPKVSGCWGDGIYIANSAGQSCKNINISYAQLDNNRRNGISVVSVDGLNLINPVISNTNGTNPMAGIDIEPNDSNDDIKHVKIHDAITFNNGQKGISLYLVKLLSANDKLVGISVVNHFDQYSKSGLTMNGFKENYIGKKQLSGKIEIINPKWKDNKSPFVNSVSNDFAPPLVIQNATVLKTGQNGREVTDNGYMPKLKQLILNKRNINVSN